MTHAFEPDTAIGKQSDDVTAPPVNVPLHLMMGVQAAMLQEMLFAGYEIFDRTRTEMHLFAEFASKIASAHSVGDIKTMWAECSQHQLDFFRRDCERLLKHSDQMVETASKLLSRQSTN